MPRTVIDYDRSLLDDNERQVVARLIDASKALDEISAELSPPLHFRLVGPLPPYSFVTVNLPAPV